MKKRNGWEVNGNGCGVNTVVFGALEDRSDHSAVHPYCDTTGIPQIQKDLVLESAKTQELLAQAERLVLSASIDDEDSEWGIIQGVDGQVKTPARWQDCILDTQFC